MLVPSGVINASQKIFDYAIQNSCNKNNESIEAKALIFGFYHSLLDRIQDINTLYEMKRYSSIEILSRTFFEQYVYIRYIIEKDTNRRSKALVLAYYINSFTDYKQTINSMEKSGRYELGAISFGDFKKSLDHLSKLENENVETWDELINDYETQYQKLVINKDWSPNFKNLKWYNLNGKLSNFRDLVKSIGLDDAEYNIAYKLPSINVHGLEIVKNISVKRESGEVIYQGDVTWFKSIKALLVLALKKFTNEIAKYYKVDKTDLVQCQMKIIDISYKGVRI